jgi:hypothetical protein
MNGKQQSRTDVPARVVKNALKTRLKKRQPRNLVLKVKKRQPRNPKPESGRKLKKRR